MKFAAILVLIVSALSILLGLLGYPVIGHDAYVHLNWLDQFTRLCGEGIAYPRWLPDSFGGFGAPTFYFYAPLVYWIASIFHLLGINSPSSLYQSVQILFSIVSVLTCFFLVRQYGGTSFRSLIGALVYSFLAYHFCDVYIRDALTEHAALAFLPIIFLRFPNRLRFMVFHSLGWTGLLLTNLPIAYIAAISIVIIIFARRSYREFPLQAGSMVIAIAVSAIYLFPAFALRGLVHQRHLFDLPMHTSQFGFALLDLFQGHFDWLRILSVATILAGLFCLIAILKNSDPETRGWKWLMLVAIFFQIPFVSAPLWHLIPGMAFVQFSWRWNGILLLAIAIVSSEEKAAIPSGVLRSEATENGVEESDAGTRGSLDSANHHYAMIPFDRKKRSIEWFQPSLFIALALITLISEVTISRNLFSRPPLELNSYLLDAPEYAPQWASNDPHEVIGITLRRMADPPAVLLGLTMPGDSISLRSKSPIESQFFVHLDRATPVRFHQFYWPYWELFRDSTEIPLTPDPNGFATAILPSGEYSVKLKLLPSSAELIGGRVSIVGSIILFILILVSIYRSIITRRETVSLPALIRK